MPGQEGWGSIYASYPAKPGAYYEARSAFSLVIQYRVFDVNRACGSYCNYYYDAFAYDTVLQNPQTTEIPVFRTIVWAAPIIIGQIYTVGKLLHLGGNGDGVQVPGGTRTVFALKSKAFIPNAWIWGAGFPVDFCVDSHGTTRKPIYAGDHRRFDPSGSYRADSEGYVSTATGAAVGPTFVDAGVTTRYADDAIAIDGYTLLSDNVLGDCHYTDNHVKGSNTGHIDVWGGAGQVTAHLYGAATNNAVSPGKAPSIDWDFLLNISTANPITPGYTLNYTHDCFPAHELYIGTQRIYGYMPAQSDPGNVGLCLAGVGQISGSVKGTVN
jgi:hypothetical protein